MSEFSLSYHVADGDGDAICERLRAARVPTYVFRGGLRWTSVLTSAAGLDLVDDDLLALLPDRLLAYSYARDHGLWMQVHEDGDLLVDYALVWDCDAGPDEVEVQCDGEDVAVLFELGRERGSLLRRDQLTALLREHCSAEALHAGLSVRPNFIDAIMTHLRIEHYDWLSFHDVDLDLGELASVRRGPCWLELTHDDPRARPYRLDS